MDHAAYAHDFEELAAQFCDCESEAELRNAQACLGRLYAHAHESGLYHELPKLPERNRIADTGGWIADAECLSLILGAIVPKLPGVLSTGGYSLTARVDSNGTLTGAADRRGDWVRLARQGFAKICRLLAGWTVEAEPGAAAMPQPDGGKGTAADGGAISHTMRGHLSASELCEHYGVPNKLRPALKKKLMRWKKNHASGFIEVGGNPQSRQPQVLFEPEAVWPIIQDFLSVPRVSHGANSQATKRR